MDKYSVKEIAEMLNTNPETVRRWIRSGKLEAIQESRKGGNVVTKSMLDAFLKATPKYAGIAASLLTSPVGLASATAAAVATTTSAATAATAAAAATIVGRIIAQQLIENNGINNASVNSEKIIKLLYSTIQTSRGNIARKKKNLKQLQEEIDEEQALIDEAENLMKKLNKMTKDHI